jgi:hypothetical protein
MTAIVAVHTPEGYILAADGRQRQGTITNDETTKIFHSSTRNSEVAWACYGLVSYLAPALNGGYLDAVESLQAVTKDNNLAEHDFSSLGKYAMKLAEFLHFALVNCSPVACYPEECFPGIVFVGNVNGKPERAKVEIQHSGCQWLNPFLANFAAHPCGLAIGYGPEMVLQGMENSEMLYVPKSLDEGRELAESYIEICIANNQKFDECKGIGGDIHIAAVTPSGFEWRKKPKRAAD